MSGAEPPDLRRNGRIADAAVTLPLFPAMSRAAIDRVVGAGVPAHERAVRGARREAPAPPR